MPVALFTRAWIEISYAKYASGRYDVALFTRAWIEITVYSYSSGTLLSRPLHEGVD